MKYVDNPMYTKMLITFGIILKKMGEKTKKTIRTFSPAFKKEKVKMWEDGQVTVFELSRLNDVSRRAISG